MAVVLKIPPQEFTWYEASDAPAKHCNTVLAFIPEWGRIVTAFKRDGVWLMTNGPRTDKRIPEPSCWANIPPTPGEFADPSTIRMPR